MSVKEARVVGFDLDGTFYRRTAEIDRRIQTRIAERILEKRSDLLTVANALEYFQREYASGQKGGYAILRGVGYGEEAAEIMDNCLATADILDLIPRDDPLQILLDDMAVRKSLFVITSSPERSVMQKLERLGIDPRTFDFITSSDTASEITGKRDGSAFKYSVRKHNLNPQECVYVGDSREADILPARALGMKTIAVHGTKAVPEADYSLHSIHDIRGLFL